MLFGDFVTDFPGRVYLAMEEFYVAELGLAAVVLSRVDANRLVKTVTVDIAREPDLTTGTNYRIGMVVLQPANFPDVIIVPIVDNGGRKAGPAGAREVTLFRK